MPVYFPGSGLPAGFSPVGVAAYSMETRLNGARGIEVKIRDRQLTMPDAQQRRRYSAPASEGEVINLTPANTTFSSVGTGSAKWSVLRLPDGRRVPAIKFNPAIGSGNQAIADVAISRKFNPDDTLEFIFYSPNGIQPNVYLTKDNLATHFRMNSAGGLGNMYYNSRKGFVAFAFAVGQMQNVNFALFSDTMTKLRISLWNTICKGDVGYLIPRIRINRKKKPNLLITTDDGFYSNLWLADQCLSRGLKMIAYLITSRQQSPIANYMTLADAQALKARGNVQIASHSHSHIYVNGGSTGYVAGSTTTGICAAQAVAEGNLALNGSVGSGKFDEPRHLTFVTTGANYGVSVDVVGRLDGATVTETVMLGPGNDYPDPTFNTFDKIVSATVSTNGKSPAGNITIGTSCSYGEIYTDIRNSFEYMEGNGLSDPDERHYCAPQGLHNESLFEALRDLGVKTCRLTPQTTMHMCDELDYYRMPSYIVDEPSATYLDAVIDFAVASSESLILYPHDILPSGAGAGTINQATLIPRLDKIGGYVASGAAANPNLNEMYTQTSAVPV